MSLIGSSLPRPPLCSALGERQGGRKESSSTHKTHISSTTRQHLMLRPTSPQKHAPLQRLRAMGGDNDNLAGDEVVVPVRSSLDIDIDVVERSALLPRVNGIKTTSPVGGEEDEDKVDWIMASLLFLFPALGGLLFGYDIGATSGALLSMLDPQLSGTDWYSLSAFQSGLVVSLSLGGALLGSGAAFVYGDRLGRRKELLLASALYGFGALGVAIAPTYPTVLAARMMYGLGIGFAMHAAPAYIAETSPPKVRGFFISLKEAFIVGGILAGYMVSYFSVDDVGGWRYMYGAAVPMAVVLAAGMTWLPESPRWLLLSGSGAPAATVALRRTKGRFASDAVVEAEVNDIEATILASPKSASATGGGGGGGGFDLSEVLRPQYRRPLTVGVSLMLFQQITGQPSVLYYAGRIFQEAGFTSSGAATAVSVVLGMFKLVMTGIAVATVDSWGRRPLLLYGVSGIIGALLLLGTAQSGILPIPEGLAAWANLLALLIYVGAYQMSFGPVSWLIVGEVFPLRVRGQAIALATLTNFGSNFAVSLVLPSLQEAYGPAAMYFGFAVIGVAALATINSIVPETKGKSLEEIERMWEEESKRNFSSANTHHLGINPSQYLVDVSIVNIRSRALSSATGDAIVDMEVTRQNFQETLPLVRKALEECAYFAFDCEMTGLHVENGDGAFRANRLPVYLDDAEDRYEEMLASSQAFSINQFGISAFIWDAQTTSYKARTFNFYTFPRPFEEYDPRFLSQAGSLNFLAGNNFDFNKWIKEGISYMPASLRDTKLASIDRERQRPDILISKPADLEFVSELVASVTSWLSTGTTPELMLPTTNSYLRALQYQELRKDQFAAKSPPGFYVERTTTEEGWTALRLIRASPREVAAWETAQRQRKFDAIRDAAGFCAVMELLRESNKPAVGHNLSLDLAYSLHSFVRPLPPTWAEYKQLVQTQFPGGVFDTKHIARKFPAFFNQSSLGELYSTFVPEGTHMRPQAVLPHAPASHACWAVLPKVAHDAGFQRYVGAEGGEYAHEAGYDAYMTGGVFACLAQAYNAQVHNADTSAPSSDLSGVAELCWRINVMRSDMEYLALKGPDLRLERPHVLYVTGIIPGSVRRPGDLVKDLGQGGVRARVSMLEEGASALIEFPDVAAVPAGEAKLRALLPGCSVASFEAYREVKEAAKSNVNGNGKGPSPAKRPRFEEPPKVDRPSGPRPCAIM